MPRVRFSTVVGRGCLGLPIISYIFNFKMSLIEPESINYILMLEPACAPDVLLRLPLVMQSHLHKKRQIQTARSLWYRLIQCLKRVWYVERK